MPEFFRDHPGRLYVLAAMLPLLPALMMLFAGTVKNLARTAAAGGGFPAWVYRLLGGDRPQAWGAYLSVGCMVLATAAAVVGYLDTVPFIPAPAERFEWVRVGPTPEPVAGTVFHVGYRVDRLSALMFGMVTVVATLIFVFSLGYMHDERAAVVEDHDAHAERRGRFGRFFVYLSLFVSAMLNLLIADNLLQIFVCWELVGVCSFFLIGFYTERPEAGRAANKAFVMNRVGDAGFLVGVAIAWAGPGTLDVSRLNDGVERLHAAARLAEESDVVPPSEAWKADQAWIAESYSQARLTHPLWVLMGLGLFLGCVGKSAQVPLQTWLPDAMAGPTPVSALIHAATMVAAGVYLVARVYPLFPPEVRLVIAYTGAVTLFVAGTTACVQTDIKKVLAYSTCSQLGFMMLALGVGGWAAGTFHLLTHAFFKALLFLCAGSVIHGLHHEQDLRRMGGLRRRMPVTATTMLVGVLAISGMPFFSGWYSKEAVLTAAAGFVKDHPEHAALFVLPLVTAGLTAYYMVRLWVLTFAGEPRGDAAHAHESPRVMTLPLVVLAAFSLAAGWGWPAWESDASYLGHALDDAAPPREVHADMWPYHLALELAAGLVAAVGAAVAVRRFRRPAVVPDTRGFLGHAWYFDAVYAALVQRPVVALARATAAADKRPTGPGANGDDPAARRFDLRTLDGGLNAVGQLAAAAGTGLRRAQAGRVRGYVLALALTVVGLLGMLAIR